MVKSELSTLRNVADIFVGPYISGANVTANDVKNRDRLPSGSLLLIVKAQQPLSIVNILCYNIGLLG